MSIDERTHQRFANFQNAVRDLQDAMALGQYDKFTRTALIKFFEIAFELAWKVLKDDLEFNGIPVMPSPREVIRKAFEVGLIKDGTTWLEVLKNFNLFKHTYDEEMSEEALELIQDEYGKLLTDLRDTLSDRLGQRDGGNR